jgi:peptide/nickel transport system substrate-binding protein
MTIPSGIRTARITRTALAGGAAAILAVALAACGTGGGARVAVSKAPVNGVLQLGFLTDPGQPPDPDVYYAGSGLALTTNIYQGLVQYADGGSSAIVPDLATSWSVNTTDTVFTFHLRHGVTFHDGTPFTSAAVQASFERRLAVNGGPAYMAEGVKSFATPDKYTSVITLDQPNSAFLAELASAYGVKMMSPAGLKAHAGKDHDQTYLQTHDLGTGPYTLTQAVVDNHYQLKAYPGYWGPKPAFTTVDFTVYQDSSAEQLALNNGTLAAIIGSVPSSAQASYVKSKALKSYALPSFQVGVFYMNPNRPFMKTAAARTALFDGIDWKSIIKQLVPESDVPATSAYSDGSVPASAAPVSTAYDPAALKKYVATLPKGTAVNIGVEQGSDDDTKISDLIAAQLQALGLKATVNTYTTSQVFGTFPAKPATAPDIMVASSTWPDASSPYLYGHVFWDPTGGLNFLQCSDSTITSDLAAGLKTGDRRDYTAAAKAEQQAMCTPIFAYARDFVVTQPWLSGVAQAHSIAAPYTLNFDKLTISK